MKLLFKRFYSQGGEDKLLWRFFSQQKKGFFIDVGAFDGVHLSNSYVFEKVGWKGICIEAHPVYYQKCKDCRQNSICIHAACIGKNNINEVTFQIEELGLLSGLKKRNEADIKKRYAARGLDFAGFKEIVVPATTINKVLAKIDTIPQIDFITIDVEGNEIDVLNGFDIKKYKPRIILLEANSEEDEIQTDNYLTNKHGYIKAKKIGVNVFYCRDICDFDKISKLKINNTSKISDHPLGKTYNYPNNKEKLITRIVRKIVKHFKKFVKQVINCFF